MKKFEKTPAQQQALKLLQSTSMSLTDVSVVSGFSDVNYLSRLLEKNYGVPAQEACRMLRNSGEAAKAEQAQTFLGDRKALDLLQKFCQDSNMKGLSL